MQFTRDLDMAEGEDDRATALVGQQLLPSPCPLGLRRWVLESLWDTGWATDRCARCGLKRVRKDSAS